MVGKNCMFTLSELLMSDGAAVITAFGVGSEYWHLDMVVVWFTDLHFFSRGLEGFFAGQLVCKDFNYILIYFLYHLLLAFNVRKLSIMPPVCQAIVYNALEFL